LSPGPLVLEIADRALVLYAFVRRATIEHVISEFAHDPSRVAQAEGARVETARWLEREALVDAASDLERKLFDATSGTWPAEAIRDGEWRREALGTLLWAIRHLEELPPYGTAFEAAAVDHAITRSGSVSSFRSESSLRPLDELDRAWMEADAWFAATEGSAGDDAVIASMSVERLRALSWLRDASAPRP
jgi:hypothetical protein